LRDCERPPGETGGGEAEQDPALTVGREVDRHHDQADRRDHDGKVRSDVPLRRVGTAEAVVVRLERACDDQHRDDGEREDERQHQRFTQHQPQFAADQREHRTDQGTSRVVGELAGVDDRAAGGPVLVHRVPPEKAGVE
jgi:hypothetical protein